MKKLIYLLFVTLLVSCTKPVTSYQIFNNSTKTSYDIDPYMNGDMYEVVVYCYAGSDIVRQDNYTQISCGEKTAIKEVPLAITKIQVSYKNAPPASKYYNSTYNYRLYVKTYYLIEQDKNIVAEVNDQSMVGGTMTVKASLDSIRSKISILK
jgi:hypothetical protein